MWFFMDILTEILTIKCLFSILFEKKENSFVTLRVTRLENSEQKKPCIKQSKKNDNVSV